jgi:hypothetical protein
MVFRDHVNPEFRRYRYYTEGRGTTLGAPANRFHTESSQATADVQTDGTAVSPITIDD